MCGLAGQVGQIDVPLLRRMSAAIAHRGPDGDGLWTDADAGVGLAHRRLAIIDPSEAAAQPMASCAGRYRVVFNGEIYNFKALARDLERAGYTFNARSDTAIIGPLYDRHGPAAFAMLDGIFAIALWDADRRELLLARDAMGVKPLYYTRGARGVAFASELKALLPALDVFDLDEAAIGSYLTRLWSPGERTPFRSVKKLLPGHFARIRCDGLRVERWDHTTQAVRQAGSVQETADDLLATFDRAVRDQCLSDVPVGAFLSGGVDSSAIVASMVASGNTPRRTYCIGFDGPALSDEGFADDVGFARDVAARLAVPLTVLSTSEPDLEDLQDLVWTLDEPQADPAPLFVAAIAQAARADGIKVLLSGAGGDDIFTGYRRHRAAALRMRFGGMRHLLKLVALPTGGGAGQRRLARLRYMFDGSDDQFLARAFEFNRRSDAERVLAPDVAARIGSDPDDTLTQALHRSRGRPLLERMLDLELHGFLPDHNLNYTDKASMRHGVEVRVPFLAPALVAFAAALPSHLKMRGLSEKWILKRALAPRLPRRVLTRPKTGFGAPVRHWLTRGKLRDTAHDLIHSTDFRQRGLFDARACAQLLEATVRGRIDGAYLVLSLVMLELWLRRFTSRTAQDNTSLTLATP